MDPDEMLKDWEKALGLLRKNWKDRDPGEAPASRSDTLLFWNVLILAVTGAIMWVFSPSKKPLESLPFYLDTVLGLLLLLSFSGCLLGFYLFLREMLKDVRRGEHSFTQERLIAWNIDQKTIVSLEEIPLLSRKNLKSHMARSVKVNHQRFVVIGAVVTLLISLLGAIRPLADLLFNTHILNTPFFPPTWFFVAAVLMGFGLAWLSMRNALTRYDHWIFLLEQSLEDAGTPKKEEHPPTLLEKITRLVRG